LDVGRHDKLDPSPKNTIGRGSSDQVASAAALLQMLTDPLDRNGF
jgi:hypothetical protein